MTIVVQRRDDGRPQTRRVWAQDVAVNVEVLRTRLAAQRATYGPDMPPARQAVIDGVETLLDKAEKAAFRRDPVPRRLSNWTRGTLIEAAYQHLHAAEAEIVSLYDEAELAAEVPEAVARVEQALHRDDPRRRAARELLRMPLDDPRRVAALRKAVEVGTSASDRQHTRVRSFRNVVLLTAALLLLLVVAFSIVAAASPSSLPLCFNPRDGVEGRVCPSGPDGPYPQDAAMVAFVGAVGGALAAAVSIRNLRGTSTPYGMPVALSLLKVPAGALTALGALIAIRGNFVPGLSNLDSQEQILAYALVFGYAQQLLTRFIDDQASSVLDSVPSKDASVGRPVLDGPLTPPPPPPPPPPVEQGHGPAGGAAAGAVPLPRVDGEVPAPEVAETDVVHLVDTEPVTLAPGATEEAYDLLRDQHFAFGSDEDDDERDRYEGVDYRDDDDGDDGVAGSARVPSSTGA